MLDALVSIFRLIEAGVLGGLIGLERERNNQPAGLRTHIILCLGSALVMIISQRVAATGANYDPGRIAAQVVSGIGFLGAGAILRMGASVRGLTTAASIWTTSAIGLAVGAGYHVEAVSVVVIMLLSLASLKKIGRRLSGKRHYRLLVMTVRELGDDVLGELEDAVSKERCHVAQMDVKRIEETGTMQIHMQISVPQDFDTASLIDILTRHGYVLEAEVR